MQSNFLKSILYSDKNTCSCYNKNGGSKVEEAGAKIAVACIVLRDDNWILLGLRKGAAVGNGTWGLPGGHQKFGENFKDAAKRVLKEETGLTAKRLYLKSIINDYHADRGEHYLHLLFVIDVFEGKPSVLEIHKCAGWKWFPIDGLPENLFYGHQSCITAYKDNEEFVDFKPAS